MAYRRSSLPDVDRREFLKKIALSGAAAALAGVAGHQALKHLGESPEESKTPEKDLMEVRLQPPVSYEEALGGVRGDLSSVMSLEDTVTAVRGGGLEQGRFTRVDVLLRIAQDAHGHGLTDEFTPEVAARVKGRSWGIAKKILTRLQSMEMQRRRAGGHLSLDDKVDVINDVMFREEGFATPDPLAFYDQRKKNDATTFDEVMTTSRGVCEDLTGVLDGALDFLRQAGLKIDAQPIFTPGHIFLRYKEGGREIYAEMTKSGEKRTREDYIRDFDVQPHLTAGYMTPQRWGSISSELNNCGLSLASSGERDKIERALQYLQMSVDLSPEVPLKYINLAGIYASRGALKGYADGQGDFKKALEVYDRGLELDPEARAFRVGKAGIHEALALLAPTTEAKLGHLSEARTEYRKAMAIRERKTGFFESMFVADTALRMSIAETHESGFLLHADAGNDDEARQELQNAIRIYDDHQASSGDKINMPNRRASLYIKAFKYLGGSEFIEKAIAEQTTVIDNTIADSGADSYSLPLCYSTRGYAHRLAGNYDEAIADYDMAFTNEKKQRHSSDDALGFYRLSRSVAQHLKGDDAGRDASYAEAIRLFGWSGIDSMDKIFEREDQRLRDDEHTMWKYRRHILEDIRDDRALSHTFETVLKAS
ncbi:MAG: twin-arginine translocation signal domain-containing protein [Candidatus Altiarchaeota archaeon]